MNTRQFRMFLPRQVDLDARFQRIARHADIEDADDRNRSADHHAIPMRFGDVIGRGQAGFLLKLSLDAAGDVEDITSDIVRIGCARREIDAARTRSVLGHLAEHKSTVDGAQRAHAEAVEDLAVGKAPIAPGEEACEIGFEIAGCQPPAREVGVAAEQYAAVPDLGLLAPHLGKMRVDLGAPFSFERPRPLFDLQVKRRDAVDDRVTWHSSPSSWPARHICWCRSWLHRHWPWRPPASLR